MQVMTVVVYPRTFYSAREESGLQIKGFAYIGRLMRARLSLRSMKVERSATFWGASVESQKLFLTSVNILV